MSETESGEHKIPDSPEAAGIPTTTSGTVEVPPPPPVVATEVSEDVAAVKAKAQEVESSIKNNIANGAETHSLWAEFMELLHKL